MQLRRHKRYPVRLQVAVRLAIGNSLTPAYSADLSPGGMYITAPLPAQPGTPARIIITSPHGESFEFNARIAHTGSTGAGMQFVDLSERQLGTICDLLPAPAQVARGTGRHLIYTDHDPGTQLAASLKRHLTELQDKDAYGVLGVSPETEPEQVETTYLALTSRWDPATFEHESAQVRELARELFGRYAHAYLELTGGAR